MSNGSRVPSQPNLKQTLSVLTLSRIDSSDGDVTFFRPSLADDNEYLEDYKPPARKRYCRFRLRFLDFDLTSIEVGLDISDYVTARSNERPSQQRVQDMIKR